MDTLWQNGTFTHPDRIRQMKRSQTMELMLEKILQIRSTLRQDGASIGDSTMAGAWMLNFVEVMQIQSIILRKRIHLDFVQTAGF